MPETEPRAEVQRQQIAKRAYALWEQEGRPDGRDLDHWLQAEAELTSSADGPLDAAATPISQDQKIGNRRK
jgi:hypothetical protein